MTLARRNIADRSFFNLSGAIGVYTYGMMAHLILTIKLHNSSAC